ncbi:MAG: hypothetical protein MH204_11850, partial [Fimbriimonadaceae bacterium]|nr:hypothetical protein [Fimbriimonadaceae bacterium]
MIRPAVTDLLRNAVLDLQERGLLPAEGLPAIELQEPRQAGHGHLATAFAMQAAKAVGQPPRTIAEHLAAALKGVAAFAGVEVAGPGFLNLTLDPAF